MRQNHAFFSSLLGTSVTYYRALNKNINRRYLYYFLSSAIWQSQAEAIMEQTTRNQVSITKQALFKVALPPIKEQKEIVSRLELYFDCANQIEERLRVAMRGTKYLTQSILAKAFRGELAPQNPDDEPAIVLLERIQGRRK